MLTPPPGKAQSLFGTNRGRAVKGVFWALAALSFVMLVLSNQGNSSAAQPGSTVTAATKTAIRQPRVGAPVADPMSPPTGVNDDVAASSSVVTTTPTLDPSQYQAMLTVAQTTAAAYGTYTFLDDPDEWVSSIPNLTPELTESLKQSSVTAWPEITSQQVTSKATLGAQSPKIVYYREGDGTAQVSVSMDLSVSTRDGVQQIAKRIALDLQKTSTATQSSSETPTEAPTSTQTDQGTWKVTQITSN